MKKKVDYTKLPESDVVINEIVRRSNQNLYTVTLVFGLPGMGKSSCAQRLAELVGLEIHGKITITENDIVSSLVDFVKIVKNTKEPNKIVIIEEISVLFPSRRAMSSDNVSIGQILDTVRKKRMIIFTNAPIFGAIDSHVRALSNISIEALGVDKKNKIVMCKPFRMQTNPKSGKVYVHRFHRNGREVHRTFTRMANKETWEKYELNKDKFMDDLYARIEFRAKKAHEKENKEINKTNGVGHGGVLQLTEREQEINYHVTYLGKTQTDTAKELGIDQSTVAQTMGKVKRKLEGYSKPNKLVSPSI